MKTICATLALLLFSLPSFSAEKGMPADQQIIVKKVDLKWGPAPQSLPPGAELAVLSGNPMKRGPFTMRLRFPAGYKLPAHTHSKLEFLTVMEGAFHVGAGSEFNENMTTLLGPGDFVKLPAGDSHFAFTTETTIVQLSGIGPFDIKFVNK